VFDDLGVDDLAPVALKRGERSFLIQPHQPRVADNIGREDRGKAALNPFLSLRHRPILEENAPILPLCRGESLTKDHRRALSRAAAPQRGIRRAIDMDQFP
jgi:hypothetical protein